MPLPLPSSHSVVSTAPFAPLILTFLLVIADPLAADPPVASAVPEPAAPEAAVVEELGVTVPEGFRVELYADDALAHDVHNLTIDTAGRVVVSGPGYVRILIDKDKDGKADEFKQFADGPASGAQGMYFQGTDLLCTGDAGLIRYRDRNRDDRADGPPDLFLKLKTGGEHNAHAIRKGADGWWYLLCGNTTEVGASYITLPSSPVKFPQHGTLLRLTADLAGGEIVAHGMRNAYDFDFNAQGEPFTFDSDDERDVSLPWYRPTRVFHLTPASHTGWLSRSWKRPDEFFDMPPVLAAFGRGSPSGVVAYRHRQFPENYRGGLFVLDWTFGRVMALPLARNGAVWKSEPIEFMTARGEHGFAPTDAEIGSDGSLFVSVGGRGTRGGVYRITFPGGLPVAPSAPVEDKLATCLSADQPLSSWARAKWEPFAKQLGADAFVAAALEETRPAAQRQRAIEILTEHFGGLTAISAGKLSRAKAPEVRAAAAWSLERRLPKGITAAHIETFLTDADPLVRRQTLDCLAIHPELAAVPLPTQTLLRVLADDQPFVRSAAIRAVAALEASVFEAVGKEVRNGDWRAALTYAAAHRLRTTTAQPTLDAYAIEVGRRVLEGDHPLPLKQDAARLVQLGLGDLGRNNLPAAFDGYASPLDLTKFERELDPLRIAVAQLYPTGDRQLDQELGRLTAMLTIYNAELLGRLLEQITPESHPVDDIHQLLVAARIPVIRGPMASQQIAAALVGIEYKFAARKLNQDTNWDDRIIELYEQLVEADEDLPFRIVEEPKFGRPGHVNFLGRVPPETLPDVIKAFEREITADANYPWNNDVVFLFGTSQEPQHRELIRDQFERFSVRSAVLMALSERATEEERALFFEGLESSQPEVLTACFKALEQLAPPIEPEEFLALVKTLRRLGTDKSEYPLRDRVAALLQKATKQSFGYISGKEGERPQPEVITAWTKWFQENYPNEAPALLNSGGIDLDGLRTLLAQVNWEKGDAGAGEKLFESRACAQCHRGSSTLGPSLSGVAGRFSREDLFIAIAVPDRDVSPRYQTTLIETKEGQIRSGLIIYESVDGVILRNSANQTFRLESYEIETQRKLSTSLMPAGLLKDLQPTDLADLYAYLQSLSQQMPVTTAASVPEE